MSVSLQQLTAELDQLLEPGRFKDYCPNGLQVEGSSEIDVLVTGVSACQQLIDAAAAAGAQAILVHHGYFWRGEAPEIVGMKRQRISSLLSSNISLLAYHLPLDAHPQLGNNAQLALRLGITVESTLEPDQPGSIGNIGSLSEPVSVAEFLALVERELGRTPLHVGDPQRQVQRVAWCTGAAQGYIEQAVAAGVDLYLTGEVSEQTVHSAREQGIEFVAAGHHATERYGVQAVGEELAQRLGIEHRFIDIDNPV